MEKRYNVCGFEFPTPAVDSALANMRALQGTTEASGFEFIPNLPIGLLSLLSQVSKTGQATLWPDDGPEDNVTWTFLVSVNGLYFDIFEPIGEIKAPILVIAHA